MTISLFLPLEGGGNSRGFARRVGVVPLRQQGTTPSRAAQRCASLASPLKGEEQK